MIVLFSEILYKVIHYYEKKVDFYMRMKSKALKRLKNDSLFKVLSDQMGVRQLGESQKPEGAQVATAVSSSYLTLRCESWVTGGVSYQEDNEKHSSVDPP